VAEFIYWGTLISNEDSVGKEILAGNITYFATISLFRSRLLSKATKIILYIYIDTNKTGSDVWSGRMDVDEERRTSCANF